MKYTYHGQSFTFVHRAPGSPVTAFAEDRSREEWLIDINWQAVQPIRLILGYAFVNQDLTGTKYISRQNPLQNPYWTGNLSGQPFLYATEVSKIEGIAAQDSISGDPEYSKARYTVLFQTLPWNILEDSFVPVIQGSVSAPDESLLGRNVIIKSQGYVEYLSYISSGKGGDSFKWVGGSAPGVPVSAGIGRHQCGEDISITWIGVPEAGVPSKRYNPSGSNFALDRKAVVNKTNFFNNPKGTMLYLSAGISPRRNCVGDRVYDIEYRFKYFEPLAGIGHNHIFRPLNNDGYLEVTTDGLTNLSNQTPGKSIYDWADFSKLFQPA